MRLAPPSYLELKAFIADPANEAVDADDVAIIQEWMELRGMAYFKGKTFEEVLEWIPDNIESDIAALKMEKACKQIAGVPSESDLEDAYNWVDSTQFTGSPKQIAWAKSIAHNHHTAIVLAWRQGKTIPTDARFWIDNRNNIVVNLPI